MLTENFLRGRRRDKLSQVDLMIIENAITEVRDLSARRTILRAGERPDFSVFLIEGVMCRYMDGRDGKRQLVAIHLPGDFIDLHAYPLTYLDHDNATITACKVGIVSHDTVAWIQRDHPQLAYMLWFSTLLDAAMHREWIFRMGRLNASGRLAHFLAETHLRMAAIGRVDADTFPLPLTQSDLAEAIGVTPVHLNRSLNQLRLQGLADVRDGQCTISDKTELYRRGEFDPSYLYYMD